MKRRMAVAAAGFQAILLATLLACAPVHGAIVGVRYTGYVNDLDNATSGFPLAVALNDTFELTFQFETGVADSLPGDPTNGRYENAITGWSARIGNQTFSAVSEQNNVIQSFGNVIAVTKGGVIPNYYATGNAYQVGTSAFMPGGITVHGSVSLRNSYWSGSPLFVSDTLIAGPVSVDAWGNRDLVLSFWDPQAGGRTIFGIAQTAELAPVPNPAAAALFASALGILSAVRRRSHAC